MPTQSTAKQPPIAKHPSARYPKLLARSRAWTPERRARQAAKIRGWQPWTRATGPRTAAGKAASSRNAARPRSTAFRRLNDALRLQGRMLRALKSAETLGVAAVLQHTDLAIDRVTATLYHAVYKLIEHLDEAGT